MKRTLLLIITLLCNHGLNSYGKNCDPKLFIEKQRNYITTLSFIKSESIPKGEMKRIKKILLKNFNSLPNNSLKEYNPGRINKYDRRISVSIHKSIKRKERLLGTKGKNKYLIHFTKRIYYTLRINLLNQDNKTLYSYTKTFDSKNLTQEIKYITQSISKFYKYPLKYCVKRPSPIEYYYSIYWVNVVPRNTYNSFLNYSIAPGASLGIKNLKIRDLIVSTYFESAYGYSGNKNINYALTFHWGFTAGHEFRTKCCNLIPEISAGYIFSYYNVKYSDMKSFYGNITSRMGVEINRNIFRNTFFAKPEISWIFEDNNSLKSYDIILGVKFKI